MVSRPPRRARNGTFRPASRGAVASCPKCIAEDGLAALEALDQGEDATVLGRRWTRDAKPLDHSTQAGIGEALLRQIAAASGALCLRHGPRPHLAAPTGADSGSTEPRSHKLRRMTPQAVLCRLRYLANRAGVHRFSPHDVRRTFCSHLLDAGADLVTVQARHATECRRARSSLAPRLFPRVLDCMGEDERQQVFVFIGHSRLCPQPETCEIAQENPNQRLARRVCGLYCPDD